jgi:hypothetical protein
MKSKLNVHSCRIDESTDIAYYVRSLLGFNFEIGQSHFPWGTDSEEAATCAEGTIPTLLLVVLLGQRQGQRDGLTSRLCLTDVRSNMD